MTLYPLQIGGKNRSSLGKKYKRERKKRKQAKKKRKKYAKQEKVTDRPSGLKYKCRLCGFCGKPLTKFGGKQKHGKRPATCKKTGRNKRKRED